MPTCAIPGCRNPADNNFGVRLRRPDTSAIWAPNTKAYICDRHAARGVRITLAFEPTHSGEVETVILSADGQRIVRRTPITKVP